MLTREQKQVQDSISWVVEKCDIPGRWYNSLQQVWPETNDTKREVYSYGIKPFDCIETPKIGGRYTINNIEIGVVTKITLETDLYGSIYGQEIYFTGENGQEYVAIQEFWSPRMHIIYAFYGRIS